MGSEEEAATHSYNFSQNDVSNTSKQQVIIIQEHRVVCSLHLQLWCSKVSGPHRVSFLHVRDVDGQVGSRKHSEIRRHQPLSGERESSIRSPRPALTLTSR